MASFMQFLVSFVFFILLVISYGFVYQTAAPVVQVEEGLIRGRVQKDMNGSDFYSFTSIPYAEPPLKHLRFKEPVPIKAWKGTLDGTADPVPCLHHSVFDFVKTNKTLPFHGAEDCLILNVYTPSTDKGSKLPVMVYIHGGSFISGRSSSYTAEVLITRNIVLVTIQYRLGILGFLSTEDCIIPGNMGLKDQQLALKWVKQNIINFGGNPDYITIFGNSAGAASVHYQILSPGSKGLFQRAILQSGNAMCPWASSRNHRNFARDVGEKFGCKLVEGSGEKYLRCMQGVEAKKLVQFATDTGEWGVAPIYVLPRVDGDFLPDHPETLLRLKKYNKVDLIMGLTKDDGIVILGTMLLNPLSLLKLTTNFARNGPLSLLLHEEQNATQLALQAYTHYLKRDNVLITFSDVNEMLKLCKDRYFGMCHDLSLSFFSEDQDITLYVYQFDHFGQFSDSNSFSKDFDRKDWVIHQDDIYYLFEGSHPYHRPMTDEADLLMRRILVSAWTNFATNGNPNSVDLDCKWKPFSKQNKTILRLTTNPSMVDYIFQERQFWSQMKTFQNNLLNSPLNVTES